MSFKILCSGISLGVYNPAIMLSMSLNNLGTPTETLVIENYFKNEQKRNIAKLKILYHQNFAFAKTARRMNVDIDLSLDEGKVQYLITSWVIEKATRFVVFSGYWMSIIEQYKNSISYIKEVKIYLCIMDVILPNSWKKWQSELNKYVQIQFFDGKKNEVLFTLCNKHPSTVLYNKRELRYIIHGGGWGIGTYQDYIGELTSNKIPLYIVCYDLNDKHLLSKSKNNRYLLSDPNWLAWDQNNIYKYPPMREIIESYPNEKVTDFIAFPNIHFWIGQSKAIISKPGGGTLLDSFMLNTPLIFLPETFADWETANAVLWLDLGFGVKYNDWKNSGFKESLLRECYLKLIAYKRRHSIPLIQDYINKVF